MARKSKFPEPGVRISIALISLAIGIVCWMQYQWFSRSAAMEIEGAYRSLGSTVMETMSREFQRYAPLLGDLRSLEKRGGSDRAELERFLARELEVYGPSGSAPRLIASVAIASPSAAEALILAPSGIWRRGANPLPLPMPSEVMKDLADGRLVICTSSEGKGGQFVLARAGDSIAVVELDAEGFFESYIRQAVTAALPNSSIEWPLPGVRAARTGEAAARGGGRRTPSFNPLRPLLGIGTAATRTFSLFVPAGPDPYLMPFPERGPRALFTGQDQGREPGSFRAYRTLMTGATPGPDRFDLREARVIMPESSAVGSIERRLAFNWLFSVLLLLGLGLAFAQAVVQKRKLALLQMREREFVASVTHELRTPVTAIRSAADNMRRGLVGSGRMVPYGEMIHAQSLRLGSMIEEVLLFSRVEGGNAGPPALVALRSEELLRELRAPLDAIARSEGVAVDWDFGSLPGEFLGDEETLRLAISNLVANAIYHAYPGPAKGQIRVIGKSLLPKAITFTVEDDGRGIPKAESKLVFDPFYRDEASRALHEKGSGLGLFIARRKARLAGGDLRLESPYDRPDGSRRPGCRFTLELPLGARPMLDKARVLIVEDEAAIRMTLGDLLAAEGCAVETRSDGPSGEAAARTGGYDIILLDLMLPGRDGLAVCGNLRRAGLQTPILMLTARGADLDVVIGLREGADDYVPKPFDGGVLIARMEALIRRSVLGAGAARGPDESRDPDIVRFGDFTLDRRRGELLRGEDPVPLNAQEYHLLEFLAANPGRVIGREEILDKVWGYDSDTTTRTIDVHVAKLRSRLGESDLPKHILTRRGRGYKFVP